MSKPLSLHILLKCFELYVLHLNWKIDVNRHADKYKGFKNEYVS